MANQEDSIQLTMEKPAGGVANGGAVILRIAGELGLGAMLGEDARHTGQNGDTALDRELTRILPTPPQLVVLDMSNVSYIASMGIGALIRCSVRLKDQGSELRLAAVPGLIAALLERFHVADVLPLYPDVDTALHA